MLPDSPPDPERREFLTRVGYGLASLVLGSWASTLIPSCWPKKKYDSCKPTRYNLPSIPEGEMRSLMWAGQPIFLVHRNSAMQQSIQHIPAHQLKDPYSFQSEQPDWARQIWRSRDPNYLAVVGICTHLGCIPEYKPDIEKNRCFYCPCHGSCFDFSGRVLQGSAAQTNLKVPSYRIQADHQIIFEDESIK